MKFTLSIFFSILLSICTNAQNCGNWLNIPNYNTQDYVSIGDLDITGNQITVEASFNADTNYFVTGTVSYDLVSKHTGTSDCNYLLRPVTAEITTTDGYYQVIACDYTPKKINHAALVYDGSTLKFYRNGFLMGSKPASGNLVTNDLVAKIGNYAFGAEVGALKGYMNEVRIWNIARTQEEIKTYMNVSLPDPTTQSGLVAYYTFDNLNNKQGNSTWNGTLHGAATINNTVPDCNFVADSCDGILPPVSCEHWLKMPDKLTGVTIGQLNVTGNQITVEAMCNAQDIYDLSRSLVSKHEDPRDVNYFLCPDLAQITTNSGFFSISSPCSFVSNKTYHAALVYDGSTLKLYRNGFLMASTPANGNLIQNNWPTTIGEYAYSMFTNNAGISNIFKGYINEVRIWNVARTQQQIRDYMNTSLPSPTTQTGLLAYYTFDNLNNKQGNSLYNGTLHGAATINTTNPNCAFVVDSCAVPSVNCTQWLNTPAKLTGVSIGQLDITGDQMTIEAMCNATDVYNLSRALVSKHEYPGDVNYFLCPDVAQITTTNGFFSADYSCGFVSNKTYHVAMVYNGSSLKLYRNGFLMKEIPATGNLITNSWPTTIGEYAYSQFINDASISNIFKGYINEVRIWNVARTQQQIKDYMNTSLPNPATQTGLLAYYTFDDLNNKQGNTLYNGSLNGAATINNTNPDCAFVADSCFIVTPVSLTLFSVKAVNNKNIEANWHTEEESGIVSYVVERSISTNGPFTTVGTVNAKNNNGGSNYTFIDNTARPNTLYFYRLRIVESTGVKKYSEVRQAIIKINGLFVNVYPNPAKDIFNVQLANTNEAASISLYNNVGQLLAQKKTDAANNSNIVISISHLAKGSYWIQVVTSKEKVVKRIEKL